LRPSTVRVSKSGAVMINRFAGTSGKSRTTT
jgi:hypothetical protein